MMRGKTHKHIIRQAAQSERVIINVSGKIFETYQSTLNRYPSSLLGNENAERETFYCRQSCQYYFNRDRNSFEAILYFYQSYGKLNVPANTSVERFITECDFFKLPKESIQMLASLQGMELMQNIKKASMKIKHTEGTTFAERARNFFEYPNSSSVAMLYMIFQSLLISVCIAGYCLNSIPGSNYTFGNYLVVLEYLTSSCFFIDTSLRFALAKNKTTFITSPLFIIDIISIPPFAYFTVLLSDDSNINFINLLKFLRILRLLRYSKISRRVSIAYVVIKDSAQDLNNFLACLLITITVSGSLAYAIEKSENGTAFKSIPQSMWWSLQTYLTIGYGDIVPATIIGKSFSAIFMSIGIITLMLPVLSLIFKLVKCMEEVNLDVR